MSKEEKSSPSSPTEQETTRELQIVDLTTSSVFKLPRGWSVEERRRINSPSHPGRVDKYYIETGTGLRFRSRIAVERYLAARREVTSTSKTKSDDQLTKDTSNERIMVKHLQDAGKIKFKPKAPKPDNRSAPSKNFSFQEKDSSIMVNPSTLDFSSLPAKVKWVLGGPGGNMWNPFVGESMVPESVKQEWSEAFADSIQLQATDNGGAGI